MSFLYLIMSLNCARIGVLSMEKKLPTKWGIDIGLFLALFFCPCPFLLGFHINVSDHNFFSITGDLSIDPSHLLSQTATGFNWIELEIWVNTLFHFHCEDERNHQSYLLPLPSVFKPFLKSLSTSTVGV